MGLLDDIQDEMKAAMKAKEMDKVSTLRMAISDIKKKLIDQKADRSEASDDLVIKTLRAMIKQRKDSIEAFSKAGRAELAAKEEAEVALLEHYLPTQMSPEQVEKLVEAVIAETGAKDMKEMGSVMQQVLAKAAGQADGKVVSELVRKKLSHS